MVRTPIRSEVRGHAPGSLLDSTGSIVKQNIQADREDILLIGEYEDRNGTRMLDHTKLRIFDIIKETEKAIKVAVEAESYSGQFREWNTWIPKSAIEKR